MKLLVLGPAGTFSHEAALAFFPDTEIIFAPNMDALFEEVTSSEILGFVPVENSLHGPVDEVVDLLVNTDAKIWRAHEMSIHHAFGAKDPKKVTTVASHPQALGQCRSYLKKHYPNAERFPVSSTSYAIDLALADDTTAAIASKTAIEEHDLQVIDEDIEENGGNTTRFAIIAKEDPFPNLERTCTSVVLHPKEDRPGLLHDLLTPFKVYDVNLTRIESRPTGHRLGEYNFFLDFPGKKDDARIQKVFKELQEIADISILGTW
jgi:prephenate dehydratase